MNFTKQLRTKFGGFIMCLCCTTSWSICGYLHAHNCLPRSTEGGRSPWTKEHVSRTHSSSWTTRGKFFASRMFGTPTHRLTLQEVLPTCSFIWGPLSHSVYLSRCWHHSHDKCSQALFLRFCILQTIKNWMVGRVIDVWIGKWLSSYIILCLVSTW